jgi:probable F420-dependent oxidoreductase
VRFGITVLATDRCLRPDVAARAVEERGFDAFYVGEHTHIPVSRRTPHPLTGDYLDESYLRTLDPWTSLAMAAAVTSRIRLGTAVALVAEHDPISLAKQVATLDHLSGGRAVLGVGYGWNRQEMQDHGVDPSRRRDVVREHVLTMHALWSNKVASFHGEFVQLEPSWAWPKPVQRPRVATWIGGAPGPTLFSHIIEYADGWMPHGGSGLREALPRLRDAWGAAGRDPSALEIVPVGVVPDKAKLEYYQSLGVTEVVFGLPDGGLDEVRTGLDSYAELSADFGPIE